MLLLKTRESEKLGKSRWFVVTGAVEKGESFEKAILEQAHVSEDQFQKYA